MQPRIYDRVRELCKQQGRPVKDVCAEAGLHPKAVAKWNTCIPSLINAARLATALHVTVDSFLH